MRKENKKTHITIFMDNLQVHKTIVVKEEMEKHGDELELVTSVSASGFLGVYEIDGLFQARPIIENKKVNAVANKKIERP